MSVKLGQGRRKGSNLRFH